MMSSSHQVVVGKIVKRKLGKGSKPDRLVNAIQTDEGLSMIVRHEGTTAYEDDQFEALIGKKVQISGQMSSFVLIAMDIQEIKEEKIETNNLAFVDEIKVS